MQQQIIKNVEKYVDAQFHLLNFEFITVKYKNSYSLDYTLSKYKLISIITEPQVWGLGQEPDMAEERQNVQPRQPNWETRGGHVDLDDLESQLM